MLLQLLEPGQTPLPHQNQGVAIGIDLGTTHSVVAIAEGERGRVLELASGRLIPSVVRFLSSGKILVGQAALQEREDFGESEEESLRILSIKRQMGKSIEEGGGITVFGRLWTPAEISGEILRFLKKEAEEVLGVPVEQAVITVPAYFDDAARTATKQAAQLAGLQVLRLLNEPTAAALAYGLDQNVEGTYAVYDLGGGTFDVSILKLQKGVFQVLATAGDIALGGDDFDDCLLEGLLTQTGVSLPQPFPQALKLQARLWKEALTQAEKIPYTINEAGIKLSGVLERSDFSAWIKPLIDRTLKICERALEDAGLKKKEVLGIVLVGGSTRVPSVQEAVANFFEQTPYHALNPDEAVALGAGLQAEALTKGSNNLLVDVIPISLGLEMMGGVVEKIIPRNVAIPVVQQQEFTTYQDGQTGLLLHIVQGEREFAEDCRSLARFELKGIPPMVAGAARIRVTFAVDADGLLSVTAEELTTGIRQQVEVKPTYGLSEEDMLRLLKAGYENAAADIQRRQLMEAKVEAEGFLQALSRALERDSHLLSLEENDAIQAGTSLLKQQLQEGALEELKEAKKSLEDLTNVFAERRVNKAVQEALTGQQVETVGAKF